MDATISLVSIDLPRDCNVIIGHAHFIKTIEDLYEALAESAPGIKFGVAFCEASGPRKIRTEGNDDELIDKAAEEIAKIGAGHTFLIFMRNAYPVNVLNAIKNVSEVCRIHAATANPLQVVIAESEQGRGVLGVIDGSSPLGVESVQEKADRYDLLRKFGYKL
ncbi:MAG: adenosine-specific kinase [Candidatus Micrarchaeota archaeon]|nr:adenosine-specific kinase [Candidatus Micrarchaeota archaeon]